MGVYFEANGHGTVVFSDKAIETFRVASQQQELPESVRNAGRELLALTQLINQAVGDAISDLLLVEAILLLRGVCSYIVRDSLKYNHEESVKVF